MSLDNRLKRINQTPVLVIAVAVAAGVGFSAGNTQTPESPSDSGLSWEGKYTVQVNGEVIDKSSNAFTYQGQNYTAGKLFNISVSDEEDGSPPETDNKFAFIGLGNGSEPDLSSTSLDEEIDLAEDNGNITRGLPDTRTFDGGSSSGNATYTLEKTFLVNKTQNDNAITVNTTGLHFNRTGPSLVSGGKFTGADLKDGDKLTVTHKITISGS